MPQNLFSPINTNLDKTEYERTIINKKEKTGPKILETFRKKCNIKVEFLSQKLVLCQHSQKLNSLIFGSKSKPSKMIVQHLHFPHLPSIKIRFAKIDCHKLKELPPSIRLELKDKRN